ncbi:MAG: STAS domain-containing protein, partial [Spirochaetes bacterium]|nr:STAS domain-containing protein [Spirochaetota bacterium]
MRISIHRNRDIVDVKIVGEYDIHEVHFFNSLFIDELNNKPATIALNLKEMTYIDSSAIGSLLRCMNMAMKDNTEFICYSLNERIEEIFRLA